jgi:dTDP-4-amino-4,6-dideoxygalactose transaminase
MTQPTFHKTAPPTSQPAIPAFHPSLPSAERILPFLRRIDSSRIYANWGPLCVELQSGLAARMSVPASGVVSAASGTAALTGAILATAGRATRRPLALLPAFTFVATATAVEACGYQPYFLDVDPQTWMLDPSAVRHHPRLHEAGLVVPVAAFGRDVEQGAWQTFEQQTGVPIVVDGAASLESLERAPTPTLGPLPIALSFHATKSFATGEGGAVVTADLALATAVLKALNFGFYDRRECATASTNGKMSEYHAAVGLAELEGWDAKRRALHDVAACYRRTFGDAGLGDRLVVAPDVAGCYALYACRDAREGLRVRDALAAAAVGYRDWYGQGLHAQPHYQSLPHDDVPVTRHLATTLVGLPVAADLGSAALERIVTAIGSAVGGR